VADLVADYLARVGDYPVLPRVSPGEVAAALPASPPEAPEPLAAVLADYQRLIEPNVTHWNHPGFFAYIAISGSLPGILGETLAAALNVNSMLWRTSPAATELEQRACDWVRQMVGLPADFRGHINDTASMGIFLALAAARQRALPEVRRRGLAGGDLPALTVYASDQAHSSVDKAAIGLGLGLDQVRRLPSDEAFRLDPQALAAAIAADRAAGLAPLAVVATAGTTSTGAIDPLAEIAAVCRREGLWLHADAAYGGGAAVCPEVRSRLAGIEAADSVIVNPHKWLFVPIDCSVLFLRRPEVLKEAFAVLPEYLKTPEQGVENLMDLGLQLGKRFRALKLWMVIRAFGVEGIRARIRGHLELARRFASWVASEPGFELAAPAPLGIVAFRAVGAGSPEAEDALNEHLLAEVNAAGPVFLSHSRLKGRYVLRVVVGNIRTEEEHVATAWRLIRETAARLRG
jgi:aromatic-L-amino-acid decarboxylase